MPRLIIPAGVDQWATFDTDVHQWFAVLATWPVDEAVTFVADVASFEPTNGSYGRVAGAGESAPVTAGVGQTFTTSAPTFPAQAGGEAWGWLGFAQDTGNDASDLILVLYRISRVTDGTDITPTIGVDGLAEFPIGLA